MAVSPSIRTIVATMSPRDDKQASVVDEWDRRPSLELSSHSFDDDSSSSSSVSIGSVCGRRKRACGQWNATKKLEGEETWGVKEITISIDETASATFAAFADVSAMVLATFLCVCVSKLTPNDATGVAVEMLVGTVWFAAFYLRYGSQSPMINGLCGCLLASYMALYDICRPLGIDVWLLSTSFASGLITLVLPILLFSDRQALFSSVSKIGTQAGVALIRCWNKCLRHVVRLSDELTFLLTASYFLVHQSLSSSLTEILGTSLVLSLTALALSHLLRATTRDQLYLLIPIPNFGRRMVHDFTLLSLALALVLLLHCSVLDLQDGFQHLVAQCQVLGDDTHTLVLEAVPNLPWMLQYWCILRVTRQACIWALCLALQQRPQDVELLVDLADTVVCLGLELRLRHGVDTWLVGQPMVLALQLRSF